MFDLSKNENPLGCSQNVVEAFHSFKDFAKYPDRSAELLCQTIASVHHIDPNRILCGCGSEDLLISLIESFAKKEIQTHPNNVKPEIIYPKHGFFLYEKIIALNQARLTPKTISHELSDCVSVDAILSAVTENTTAIILDHPGNPGGQYLQTVELKRLIDNVPPRITIVIDSAYAEYMYGVQDYTSGLEFAGLYPNIIVTRTFSKAYGLAGLRIGWLYASEACMEFLNTRRTLFKASAIAQHCAIEALKDQAFLKQSIEHTLYWREQLEKALEAKQILALNSFANFVVVKQNSIKEANELREKIELSCDILCSDLSVYGFANYLRISIGSKEAMEKLISFLLSY